MTFQSFPSRLPSLATYALAAALFAGSSAGAQKPQCMTAYGAMMKMWDTPWHLSMIDSSAINDRLRGGKPTVDEEIYVGGIVYVKVKGQWRKSPVDIAEMRKDGTEHLANDKSTCTHVRDEIVGGEGTSVWSIHSVTEDGTNDSQIWISRSRGSVVRSETNMDVGGSMGKSHMVAIYDYANVRAPAGAQ